MLGRRWVWSQTDLDSAWTLDRAWGAVSLKGRWPAKQDISKFDFVPCMCILLRSCVYFVPGRVLGISGY